MSGTATTIDGTAGGTVFDQDGDSLITVGSSPTTVVASLGTDTILGGAGSLTVTATSDGDAYNPNPIFIQAGTGALDFTPGDGDDTVIGGQGSVLIESGDTLFQGTLHFVGGQGPATVWGSLGGTVITGGPGTVELDQNGVATISAGTGTLTIVADGNPLDIIGADGLETLSMPAFAAMPGEHLVATYGSGGTTITNQTTGVSSLLKDGTISTVIDGSAGGAFSDLPGLDTITLGGQPATINAGQGTDTITAGNAPLTVDASGNSHSVTITGGGGALTVTPGSGHLSLTAGSGDVTLGSGDAGGSVSFNAGSGNATLVGASGGTQLVGGTGSVALAQRGATTITGGAGSITVTADGTPLKVTGIDNQETASLTPGPGEILVIARDGTGNTTLTNQTANTVLRLAGGSVVQLIDGSGGGAITDAPGLNLITLGSTAATVTASLGTDTINGGTGQLVVSATSDTNPLVINAAPGAQGTTVLGGAGSVALQQHGTTAIAAGHGNITITSDGTPIVVTGADGLETTTALSAAGDTVLITTDSGNATTVTDTTAGIATLLTGGHAIKVINDTAGGAVTDQAGLNLLNLGPVPTTVTASAGMDTINAGSGALLVDATANTNALTINAAAAANGVTVLGGAGTIALQQNGATRITPGRGTVSVTSDGTPLLVIGADFLEADTLNVAAGAALLITTDGSNATTITNQVTGAAVVLADGQITNLVDGTLGGLITDVPGRDLITLGSNAATVTASAGTDTIHAGSGPLTVDATGNTQPLRLNAGSGALTFTPGPGAETVFGGTGNVVILPGGVQGTLNYQGGAGSATITGAAEGAQIYAGDGPIQLTQTAAATVFGGAGSTTIKTNGDPLAIVGLGLATAFEWTGPLGDTLVLGHTPANATTVTDQQTGDIYTLAVGGATLVAGSLAGPADPLATAGGSPYIVALRQQLGGLLGSSGRLTYFAAGNPVPPVGVPSLLISTGGAATITMPAGVRAARNQIAGTDLQGSGAAGQFITSTAGFTYHSNGGSGIVLADDATAGGRAGNNHIVLPRFGGGDFLASTGAGDDTVEASSGNATIGAGAGSNTIFLGSGSALVTSSGADTIVSGSGAATVQATAGSQALVFGGPNSLLFQGGAGAATVIGGSGAATMEAGSGTSIFWGSANGNNVMYASTGAATLVGGGANNLILAAGGADKLLVAGTGNSTLFGGSATGTNMYWGSRGDDLIIGDHGNDIIIGGPGHDVIGAGAGDTLVFGGSDGDVLFAPPSGGTVNFISNRGGGNTFAFSNGQGGGTDIIWGYRPGVDQIALQGYAPDEATRALSGRHGYGAGTELFLSDGTRIVFGDVQLTGAGWS